jgi:RimJ/RimL family protein N-acetyltransferase
MSIEKSLFKGELITLTPVDPEKDAELISGWTHDAETMGLCDIKPVRPLSAWKVKKMFETMEKEMDDKRKTCFFAIRILVDQRLIGLVQINAIDWVHRSGKVKIVIGDNQDRRQGYGSETLQILLRYSFSELNLHRLEAILPEYNQAALDFFTRAGFLEEVRQRQAINRYGRRWDLIFMGLLKDEWRADLSAV